MNALKVNNLWMEAPALWAFEEDILTRSWSDWIIAHTSFLEPLHRYEGLLNILPNRLSFSGIDKRTGKEVFLDIFKHQIEQLYLGFDEAFNAGETRDMGLTWLPLRLTFTQGEQEEKLYIIVNNHLGRNDNTEYFKFLKNWLK